ncbi:MAG: uracil-DNA glycosylase [Candidatus Accumulibacter sp.]|jgi:DNA polymerase|nr:uracil-DNA glycosylase [Accumulibacter sp.]
MKFSRQQILREMGISPYWVLREPSGALRTEKGTGCAEEAVFSEVEASSPVHGSCSSSFLPANAPASETTTKSHDSRAKEISEMSWDQLRQSIAVCRTCGLCNHRKQAVPGVGDKDAAWMFIGEGPGAEEDKRGEPFVGQAGKLLDAMLAAIDLKRGEDVYIANAVKCRPLGNRTPEVGELAACQPYLRRQIELVSPKLIVLLGRIAVSSALGHEGALSGLRGQRLRYVESAVDIPVVVTYHPAYLLRNLSDKAMAWEDLCRARELMRTF